MSWRCHIPFQTAARCPSILACSSSIPFPALFNSLPAMALSFCCEKLNKVRWWGAHHCSTIAFYMANHLMTAKLAEQLKDFPLYSQDGKQKNATCVCFVWIWTHPLVCTGGATRRQRLYFVLYRSGDSWNGVWLRLCKGDGRHHGGWLTVWTGHVEH